MNKELEKELKQIDLPRRNWYHIKKCIDCGVGYVGGTTSKRCYECDRKNTKELKVERKKYKKNLLIGNLPKKCFFCERQDRPLEIHHTDANGGNNNFKNLLVLCISCHRKLHGKIYNKIYNPKIRQIIKLAKEIWQKEHPKN